MRKYVYFQIITVKLRHTHIKLMLEGCTELSTTPVKVSLVAETQNNNFFVTPNPFRIGEHT